MEEVTDCLELNLWLKVAGCSVVSSLLDVVLIELTDDVEESLLLDSLLLNVMVGPVEI